MIQITDSQYKALLRWAEKATQNTGEYSEYLTLRMDIDGANEIKRYTMVVLWNETTSTVAGNPKVNPWPPFSKFKIEQFTPITKFDVEHVLETSATNPTSVMVTLDPKGEVGWTEIDQFPWG